MKKLFFSSSGGDPRLQSSFVGKVLRVGSYQCTVEEVIAEGKERLLIFSISYLIRLSGRDRPFLVPKPDM